jgi:hypothetical protein
MTVRTPISPSPATAVAGPVALPAHLGPLYPSAIEEHQEHRV